MNSVIGALRVILGLDTAEFDRGLSSSERKLERYGRSMQTLSDKVSRLGASLSLGVTAPLAAIGVQMSRVALDAGEMQSAFDVSFGGMAGAARAWAEKTGDALHRSTTEMQSSALAFHGLFKAGGPATAQTRALAEQFAVLAQDLSSFHNVSPEDALERLRSGLSGEAEPLRRFNVYLTESAVRAEAVRLGIGKMKGELSETAKIQARASLIMKGTTEAQGDVIRTMDSGANKIRAAQSAWQELSVAIGTKLIPAFTPLVDKITAVLEAFGALPGPVQSGALYLAAFGAALGPAITGIGGLIGALGSVGPLTRLTQAYVSGLAGSFTALSAANLSAAATTTAVSAMIAGQSTGMAVLRGATAMAGAAVSGLGRVMLALVGGPLGLTVLAIGAVATGLYLYAKNAAKAKEATADVKAVTNTAAKSAQAYAAAVDALTGKTKAEIEAARQAIIVKKQAAERDLAAARAALVLARAKAEEARATLAANRAAANDPTNADYKTRTGLNLVGSDLADRSAQAEANVKAYLDSIRTTSEVIEKATADLKALTDKPPAGAAPDLDADKKAKKDRAETEAWQREQQRLEAQLEAARLAGDLDQIRTLEDQIDRRQRIRDYQEQGLSLAAATTAAERDLKVLAEARAKAQAAALADHADDVALQVAQIRGDEAAVQLLQDKAERQRLIVFYQEQGKTLAEAERLAAADLAKIEAARLETRKRLTDEAKAEFELELARTRGDTEDEIRRLEQAREIERRTREIMSREGVGEGEARTKAEAEVAAIEDARVQGAWRETFKGGFKAALEGDFKGWFQNWFADRVSKAMEQGLNTIADLLMKIFREAMGQSAQSSGGGGWLGALGDVFGGIFGGGSPSGSTAGSKFAQKPLPGFKTGGSAVVGGSGGPDSKIVSFRATPGELIKVTHGEDNTVPGLTSVGRAFESMAARLSKIAAGSRNIEIPRAVSMIDAPARSFADYGFAGQAMQAAANDTGPRGALIRVVSDDDKFRAFVEENARPVAQQEAGVVYGRVRADAAKARTAERFRVRKTV